MKRSVFLISCVFIVCSCFMTGTAIAAYPNKPIVIATYSGPGGGTDIFLRNLAKHMEPYLGGTSIVVENKPGGGSSIAMNYVINARPDGYTLLGVTPTFLITSLVGKTAHTYRDMTAVGRFFVDPTFLFVKYDSPFKSLKDIIEHARKNPGKQRWGLGTVGATEQLIAYQVRKQAKVEMVDVPFEGGGDLMVAVLGGHVDLGMGEPQELLGQVEAKKLRLLCVFTEQRVALLPDVPTARENSGYDIMIPAKFRGLAGPKGLPAEVHKWWEEKIQQVLNDKKYKSYYESVGLLPAFQGSKDFAATIEKDNTSISEFLKAVGLFKEYKGKK